MRKAACLCLILALTAAPLLATDHTQETEHRVALAEWVLGLWERLGEIFRTADQVPRPEKPGDEGHAPHGSDIVLTGSPTPIPEDTVPRPEPSGL